jgi:hypothetical protein
VVLVYQIAVRQVVQELVAKQIITLAFMAMVATLMMTV